MQLELSEKLSKRLAQPLPGEMAHRMMATAGRIEKARQIPENHRVSAVLVLLYPGNGYWNLPLIKRPEYDGVHSGQMAFPGGKWEEGDLSLTFTAIRETEEEIGVQITKEQVVGTLSDLYIPPSNMLVTPVVAVTGQKPSYTIDPLEVAKVVDVRLTDLQNPDLREFRTITVMDNIKLKAPTFQIAGETIWGATAMMLSELLQVWDELS